MNESVIYTNIEHACCVMDSVCDSPMLPPKLYGWQTEAWKYIRAYIKECHKPSTNKTCLKLPLFSKYKEELSGGLRKNNDPLLVRWYMAGAKAMLDIVKRQLQA